MNIRSITVERGIATLTHQTHLRTILSLSRSSNNTSDNVGASSVEAISSRTGVPAARQEDYLEEWELEEGHFDDHQGPSWFPEGKDEDNEAIRQVDRRIIRCADDDV